MTYEKVVFTKSVVVDVEELSMKDDSAFGASEAVGVEHLATSLSPNGFLLNRKAALATLVQVFLQQWTCASKC